MRIRNNHAFPLKGLVLLLGVLLGGGLQPGHAQSVERPGAAFYGTFGGGFSDYTGEFPAQNSGHPFDLQEFTRGSGFPFTASGEIGYQFSPRWSVGVGFQVGNYPIVGYAGGPSGISDSYRYTPQLLGRYTFGGAGQTVAPYVDLGVNATFGGDRPPTSLGYGPSVGGGIDILLSRTLSFYLESRFNFTLPDDAVDGAAGGANDAITGPFDAVNQLLGFGLKVRLAAPTPPRVVALNGPATVRTDTAATFTATVNDREVSRPMTYRWAFGDGKTGSGRTATHAYDQPGTYTVTFTARNEAGTASRTLTVEVTEPATPPRIVSLDAPSKVPVGTSATFAATVNKKTAARPLSYEWQFGDGTAAQGRRVSHTYDQPGTYTAVFTARNDAGTASESVTVAVAPTRTAQAAKIVSVNAAPNPASVGQPVRFRSTVEGRSPIRRQWIFGDGATATGTAPTHAFSQPGQYTVRLAVSNEVGADTSTVTLRVSQGLAGQWAIVVASMSTRDRAETMAQRYREKMSDTSLPVTIVRAETPKGTRHRVAIGRFGSRKEAQQAFNRYRSRLPSGAWLLSP